MGGDRADVRVRGDGRGYSGNHHTCSYNFFVLLFCSLDYISITIGSNGNLTT